MRASERKIDRGVLDALIDLVPRPNKPGTSPPLYPTPIRHVIREDVEVSAIPGYPDAYRAACLRAEVACALWISEFERISKEGVALMDCLTAYNHYDSMKAYCEKLASPDHQVPEPCPPRRPPRATVNSVICGYSGETWSGQANLETPLVGDERMFLETPADLLPKDVVCEKLQKKVENIGLKDPAASKALREVLMGPSPWLPIEREPPQSPCIC